MFEVFVCRIYSQSLINDFIMGGAMYIPTGRGFPTTRVPFYQLYSRFVHEGFYLASQMFLMLLYSSLTMWDLSLVYFWGTVIALFFSPFWFNPNQFAFAEYFLDYQRLLKWFMSGNVRTVQDSWVSHVRQFRISMTGSKRRHKPDTFDPPISNNKRPSRMGLLAMELLPDLLSTSLMCTAFMYSNAQSGISLGPPANSFLRLIVVALGPIGINIVILVVLFVFSCTLCPLLSICSSKLPDIVANIAHLLSVVNYIAFFDMLLLCQNWSISRTILGAYASYSIEGVLFRLLTILVLSREFKNDRASRSWWTGLWFKSRLGWHVLTQPTREFGCKVIEMSIFAQDFIISHFILACLSTVLLIPYIDTFHPYLVLWLKPEHQLRKPLFSLSKRRERTRNTVVSCLMFALILVLIMAAVIVPYTMATVFDFNFDDYVPEFALSLLQPVEPLESHKGLKHYIPYGE